MSDVQFYSDFGVEGEDLTKQGQKTAQNLVACEKSRGRLVRLLR